MKKQISLALCFTILLSILSISPALAKKNYDFLWAYHNGIAQFEKSKKIGLMNEAGEIILPAEYNEINPCFQNGYTWVIKNGLYGLIDDKGNVMIKPQYKYLDQVSSGLAATQDAKTGLYGYVDVNGNWVVEPKYYLTQPFCGKIGVAYVDKDSGKSQHAVVFNTEGEIINDLGNVHWIGMHSSNPFNGVRVRDDVDYPNFARGDAFAFDFEAFDYNTMKGIGILNEEGQIVDCSQIGVDSGTLTSGNYHFHDGLLQVSKGDLWGYINRNGEIVIEPQPMWTEAFYNGKAYVEDDSGSYFIDTSGNKCNVDDIVSNLGPGNGNFSTEYRYLDTSKTDKFGRSGYGWTAQRAVNGRIYIYSKGKELSDYVEGYNAKYENVDRAAFSKLGGGSIYAYVKTNSREILYENTFDIAITDYGCGLYKVMDSKGKTGFIDENGELVSGLQKKGQ